MKTYLIVLVLIKIITIQSDDAYCEGESCSEGSESTTENKYSQDLNEPEYAVFLKKISDAEKLYTECNFQNSSCYFKVLSNDLARFKNGISKASIERVYDKGTKYQIINKRLYRQADCMFPSRCSGVEYFLLRVIDKLPDMELIINTRDWPQLPNYINDLGPVFSFSKTKEYGDIMYPAWSFWEGGPAMSIYPKGLGRWDQHRTSLRKTAEQYPWDKKVRKGFFRGSRTSGERDALILLSRRVPHLVDAQYTKNQAWKSKADTLGTDPAKEVTLEDHCKYSFLFNLRGVAASFRFKHLFLCKSLVFHVGDDWIEFFYPEMKPWVHYIPVNKQASEHDLELLIKFALTHESKVKEIAERGAKFIWEHLKMSDVLGYWNELLKRYAKLLRFKPVLDRNLMEIKQK